MYLENYTGVLSVERRIRGLEDIRFPGIGISFTSLGWGVAGAFLGAIPAVFIIIFLGFGVIGWIIAAAVIAAPAYFIPRFINRQGNDGRTVVARLAAWAIWRITPTQHADGVPFRDSGLRLYREATLSAASRVR